MTLLIDTTLVLALYDGRDDFHEEAVAFYADVDEDVYTTPMIAAEMDHLIAQRAGKTAVMRLWENFDSGAILLRWWSTATAETIAIARAHPKLGLADASLLALSPVARTTRIATFDRKHFSAARTAAGEPFTLLP